MDNAGPDGAIFSKPEQCLQKNALSGPRLCQSGLSLIALSCSAGQILVQKFTAHERQFLQGNLFIVAFRTHEVPFYLCSIFCSPSLVQLSTVSYCILGVEQAPN